MRRRLLANTSPDVIHLEIWVSVIPPAGYTPEVIWAAVNAPQTALYAATQLLNVPMNLTFMNATVYDVRSANAPNAEQACVAFSTHDDEIS